MKVLLVGTFGDLSITSLRRLLVWEGPGEVTHITRLHYSKRIFLATDVSEPEVL